jgi:ABC-type multidrug transport system ATPase subunit
MIRVNDLVLSRGTQKPVSFQISEGEVMWIRGANGKGKSTLLLTLLGEIPKRSGEIYIDEQKLSSIPTRELGSFFGYAPQIADFQGEVQVSRVLELLKIDQSSPLLARLGIDGFLDSSVVKLSGGEKQRLQIAISVLGRGKFILLDEPIASQDSAFKTIIEEVIGEQAVQGKAFIIASHIPLHETRIIDLD